MANGRLMQQIGGAIPAATATWGYSGRSSFHSVMALLMAALLLSILYLAQDTQQLPPPPDHELAASTVDDRNNVGGRLSSNSSGIIISPPPAPAPAEKKKACDVFSGRWVFDNVSYPLYRDCNIMPNEPMKCENFGRKDLNYQKWRWQPHHCHLPRFNATELLENLRNKRMVFVGDSLNRGQWSSMVCLVESAIPSPSLKSLTYNGSLVIFRAKEYNATIEYYWEPFLVESNGDDPVRHRMVNRIVRVQALEKHARHWSNAHVLVFDTYLWWRSPEIKVRWGSFNSSDSISKDVKTPRAYEMALQTWSDWLEIHINRTKTQVFFMSASPTHEKAEEWGGEVGQSCYQETQPITKQDYWGSGSELDMIRVVESVINKLDARGLTVKIINITQLSEYRKDAHPSIHRKQWTPLTQQQLADPLGYSDCDHWCLPGVPDVWNELLYAHILPNKIPLSLEE